MGPIVVDRETHRDLFDLVTQVPNVELTVDLASQVLFLPDKRQVSFPIDPFAKTCLLQGVDELGYLLAHQDEIAQFEREHAV
jgi:3-isopropylmalate/(R)-2-methylmalate dehydratase small subunit